MGEERVSEQGAHSALCASCGRRLSDGEAEEGTFCSACAIEDAERRIPSRRESLVVGGRPDRKALFRAVFLGVLVVALFVVLVLEGPGIVRFAAPQDESPAHAGVQKTDRVTDECMQNLTIAADEYARAGSTDITCPATSKPYVITDASGTAAIACPNPSKHDLKSLSIDAGTGLVTAGE